MNVTVAPTPSQALLIYTITSYYIFGILGIASSVITVVVIACNKSLQSNCYILIAAGGIGSLVSAGHFLLRATDKLAVLMGLHQFERSGLQCFLWTSTLCLWGIEFNTQITCLIAVDRLISVLAPMKYRIMTKSYIIWTLVITAILDAITWVVGLLTSSIYQQQVVCSEINVALHPLFTSVFTSMNLGYCIFNVLAYAAMLICFRYRQKSISNAAACNDVFAKQQLSVMPTVKMVMILYLFSGVLAEAIIDLCFHLPQTESTFFLLSLGMTLKNASTMVEGCALMIRNKKFRQCFFSMFGKKRSAVEGIQLLGLGLEKARVKSVP